MYWFNSEFSISSSLDESIKSSLTNRAIFGISENSVMFETWINFGLKSTFDVNNDFLVKINSKSSFNSSSNNSFLDSS
ncbi:hypothetical protein WICMUC_003914 [Wickerhamomyces mucosus]|uniref:Uncharacterized protein n=1 Tax=Wickerhamomyces mucosus TaxID=1378264 RepID=A0A9P8TBJ3_9ASCO|nr:hypothetical protein WICMUC_003914 [Wickerhamomyces mucosus]